MVERAFCCRDAVLGTECFIVDGSFPVSAIIPHFKEKSNRGKAFLNKYIYKVILKKREGIKCHALCKVECTL